MLKSGKSINVLSHVMQLLAVVTLFTEAVICLSVLIMNHAVLAVNRFFNLFRRSPYWEDISTRFVGLKIKH